MTANTDRSVRRVSRREVVQGTGVALGSLVASGGLTERVMAQSGGPTDEISGVVEDDAGPVEGATVVAVPHDTSMAPLATTTAADGTYQFEQSDLYEGSNLYHVIARDGSESAPRRGEQNYPFVAAEGPDTIPDSVVYQYPVSTFGASTWTDHVGSADMTVNGMVSSTFSNGEESVFGDGTDDYGLANGPQTLPSNETFGVAFTISYSSPQDFDRFAGAAESSAFEIRTPNRNATGDIEIVVLDDNSNALQVHTDSGYGGQTRAVVINKNGNSAADMDIYVDDMATPVSTTVYLDDAFDHTNFSLSQDLAFWARNNAGTIGSYLQADAGVWEFNSSPYSQSDREGFVSRRPEV